MNLTKTSIIYSQENCPACMQAKALLESYGYAVEERKISADGQWTKKLLLDAVPNARSVPQIFVDGVYVGGIAQLRILLTT